MSLSQEQEELEQRRREEERRKRDQQGFHICAVPLLVMTACFDAAVIVLDLMIDVLFFWTVFFDD